jgi:6-pyruvoyltetrahydropterin/6-carboxytetrahydropterin synthase
MIYEISQRFFFEAAHTLERKIDTASSKRIHGHTYQAEVTVRGPRNPETGMILDLGVLRREIEAVREVLDHAFLDEVPTLGAPTLENLCTFIAERLRGTVPAVSNVRVWREASGDACRLTLAESS